MIVLETERLRLRTWRDDDVTPMTAISSDPRVMAHFPALQGRDVTSRMIGRLDAHFQRHGYSLFATEETATGRFIGFVGLLRAEFPAPFTPATEIGWRLGHAHWGNGYATEAAAALLRMAFDRFRLDEVVSFTVPANRRSRWVMEKIGLRHDPADDFDHPLVPRGSPLRRHVLYRISREGYASEHPKPA